MNRIAVSFLLSIMIAIATTAEDLAVGDWIKHGFHADARARLLAHLDESVRSGKVPGGAMLLLHQGRVIFREDFGFAHIRREEPFSVDAPFRIASISKPIIATLTVKLSAEGRLDLDQSIDAYLPEMNSLRLQSNSPIERAPTIAECLKHTAGFVSDYEEGGRPWLTPSVKGKTLAQVVGLESQIPMRRSPGQAFAYSGIGYDIVGRIIEVVTQRSLNDVMQEELCVPLGMAQTTYYPEEAAQKEMPSFYWQWRSDGGFRRRLDQRTVEEGQYASVGGAIISTADDLAKFMMLHRNAGSVDGKQFIDAIAMKRMYTREKPGAYYGLGFTLGPAGEDGLASWIYHSGSSGTMLWLDRTHDVIGVIATQHSRSSGAEMPETEKVIPLGAPNWQSETKEDFIDPVFGWTGDAVSGRSNDR
jgi:CubicO group peptidase (beta-lactamase class C family)